VIIWLNGAFGCGKTTTASELSVVIPGSRLFDPETVGYMLRPQSRRSRGDRFPALATLAAASPNLIDLDDGVGRVDLR